MLSAHRMLFKFTTSPLYSRPAITKTPLRSLNYNLSFSFSPNFNQNSNCILVTPTSTQRLSVTHVMLLSCRLSFFFYFPEPGRHMSITSGVTSGGGQSGAPQVKCLAPPPRLQPLLGFSVLFTEKGKVTDNTGP